MKTSVQLILKDGTLQVQVDTCSNGPPEDLNAEQATRIAATRGKSFESVEVGLLDDDDDDDDDADDDDADDADDAGAGAGGGGGGGGGAVALVVVVVVVMVMVMVVLFLLNFETTAIAYSLTRILRQKNFGGIQAWGQSRDVFGKPNTSCIAWKNNRSAHAWEIHHFREIVAGKVQTDQRLTQKLRSIV